MSNVEKEHKTFKKLWILLLRENAQLLSYPFLKTQLFNFKINNLFSGD